MADGISCDRCGETLLIDSEVRYVVTIEVYAAYDPLEIASRDEPRDFDREYRRLLDQIENATAEELEQQVYVRRVFDLCPKCQAHLLADPLGRRVGPDHE